jgi:polyisoprenoid-binding protein YceI
MDIRRTLRRPLTWIIAIPVVAVLALVVGPFVYIEFIKDDPPARLGFSDLETTETTEPTETTGSGDATPTTTGAPATTAAPAGDASGLDGTWAIAADSIVGYRVKEVLAGQDTEGVGRTSAVTGSFTISGTTVSAASFEVDMTTFESDSDRRDSQFEGRIMEVDTYPTATFTLTEPIELGAIPADLEEITIAATGELTLHGTTEAVTFDLVARRNGAAIEITGSLTIVFEEWGIPNPSNGLATTGDDGVLEIALALSR